MHFTRGEVAEAIDRIMDWMDCGKVEKTRQSGDKVVYTGHPAFYFFHSRDEVAELIENNLTDNSYDEYSLCRELLVVLKFLLGPHDSHTNVTPLDLKMTLFGDLWIEGDCAYIIACPRELKRYLGWKIVSINGVPTAKLLEEVSQITRYATDGGLHHTQSLFLRSSRLRMLPSFTGSTVQVDYVVSNGGRTETIHGGERAVFSQQLRCLSNWFTNNYTYELGDDYIVLHYNRCGDVDRMNQFITQVEQVVSDRNITKCIVDIRNNLGGSDGPSYVLCDWLRGRFDTLVSLVNEWVYSSGMSTALALRDVGAYTIGTDIGDSPCAFGNVVTKDFPEYGIVVRLSTKLMVAQPGKLRNQAWTKETFRADFQTPADLPQIWYFHPDLFVRRTVADAMAGRDPQIDAALSYLRS